jgi:hypothetical protein
MELKSFWQLLTRRFSSLELIVIAYTEETNNLLLARTHCLRCRHVTVEEDRRTISTLKF